MGDITNPKMAIVYTVYVYMYIHNQSQLYSTDNKYATSSNGKQW